MVDLVAVGVNCVVGWILEVVLVAVVVEAKLHK